MATIAPYIPESITVHLGSPDSNAENVTVSFSDYVKNVLSSEVYPTWEPAALRANALAIISFALNRIYTEYYRSRGYSFDITSSTAIDQKFINGRNIYENISELVDELFTDYLRKQGFVEPLAAKFCNGVTVTCSGLSQWGVAVSGAGRRKLHRHSAHLLRGGRGVCDERARAEFAGVLPRQPRAAGRYRRERVVFAGRAQPHFAELPRHSQGSCRRHLRRGDGKRRARVPVHFFSDSRRHCRPRDVVHNRDALYGGSEAGRAAIAGADVLRLFIGNTPSRSCPANRARR